MHISSLLGTHQVRNANFGSEVFVGHCPKNFRCNSVLFLSNYFLAYDSLISYKSLDILPCILSPYSIFQRLYVRKTHLTLMEIH